MRAQPRHLDLERDAQARFKVYQRLLSGISPAVFL